MKSTIFRIKLTTLFKIVDFLTIPIKLLFELFFLINRKPFSQGYEFYKWRRINKYLDSKAKKLYVKNASGLDERIIEYKWIFNQLGKIKKNGKLLDAGSTINFPDILKRIKNKYKITIQTLYPENYCFYDEGISYVYEDLSKKIFKDNSFDIITCISTLEHIGFDNKIYNKLSKFKNIGRNIDYLKVIENFRKCLKKGGTLLLTLPYGIHQKFNNLQQFDEKMVNKIIKKFNPSRKLIKYAKYSNKIWCECLKKECDKLKFANNLKYESADNLASARGLVLIKLVK